MLSNQGSHRRNLTLQGAGPSPKRNGLIQSCAGQYLQKLLAGWANTTAGPMPNSLMIGLVSFQHLRTFLATLIGAAWCINKDTFLLPIVLQ